MDPYLERPDLWPNVHNSLIIALRDDLAPRLRPRYYVAVEERTVQTGTEALLFALRPDVAVMQTTIGTNLRVKKSFQREMNGWEKSHLNK
jgi:hypothetical protein